MSIRQPKRLGLVVSIVLCLSCITVCVQFFLVPKSTSIVTRIRSSASSYSIPSVLPSSPDTGDTGTTDSERSIDYPDSERDNHSPNSVTNIETVSKPNDHNTDDNTPNDDATKQGSTTVSRGAQTTKLEAKTTGQSKRSNVAPNTNESGCPKRIRVFSASGHKMRTITSFVHHLAKHMGIQEPVRYLHVEARDVKSDFDVSRYFLDECELSIVVIPRSKGYGKIKDFNRKPITKVGIMRWAIQERENAKRDPENHVQIPSDWVDKWHNQIFWSSREPVVKLVNRRPLLIHETGATFKTHQPHPQMDIVLYRAKVPIQGTLTGHYLEFQTRGFVEEMNPLVRENIAYNAALLQEKYQHQVQLGFSPRHGELNKFTKEEYREALRVSSRKRTGFMAMVNSSLMERHQHRIDAIVRFAFCELVSKAHKPCVNLSRHSTLLTYESKGMEPPKENRCPGGDLMAFHCYGNFRFALTMENQSIRGYVSEKIVNGRLSGAVPVYFGAEDVGDYLNPDSFVHCKISTNLLRELRSYENHGYAELPQVAEYVSQNEEVLQNYRRPVVVEEVSEDSTPDSPQKMKAQHRNPTDEDLLAFGIHLLRDELQTCVDRVIALDKDEERYLDMLMAPFYREDMYVDSVNDGFVLAKGISDVIRLMQGE